MQLLALKNAQTIQKNDITIHNNGANTDKPHFKDILSEKHQATDAHFHDIDSPVNKDQIRSDKVNLLAVGKISPKNPTVSDILFNHPAYGKQCWEIIHSNQNKGKPFNSIQVGTQIFINPKTNEISWDSLPKRNARSSFKRLTSHLSNPPIQQLKQVEQHPDHMQFLGRITDKNPTVSSLLVKHPEYDTNCWQIIHTAQNNGKPFGKIKPGTAVYINTNNLELSWKTKTTHNDRSAIAKSLPYDEQTQHSTARRSLLSDQLESSVRAYLGRPYSDFNCYELVIRGLRHVGIQYSGKNGLKEKLVQMALNKGLPTNSYLTGEGIIKTTSNEIFSKSFQHVANPKRVTEEVIKEVAPFLNNGLILSFSTPTRGHMGVVSNNNDMWTFINSGNLDNPFSDAKIKKGVGEEVLASEIYNWVRLAKNRNEPLKITLGEVTSERLAAENLTVFKKLG